MFALPFTNVCEMNENCAMINRRTRRANQNLNERLLNELNVINTNLQLNHRAMGNQKSPQ